MPTTETMSHRAEEIGGRLGERAKSTLEEAARSIQTKSEDAWEDLAAVVKKHPGKTLGIAVAAGVAVGASIVALSQGRRTSVNPNLRNLAGSGVEAWDRVKSGLDEAVCNLKDAFEDALHKFNK